jgi:hypothetical protein
MSDTLTLGQVYCGHGATLNIAGYGNLWPLGNVLCVPGLTHNIISVKMLTSHGWAVNFIGDKTSVMMDLSTMNTIMTASVKVGLYMLQWDRHIDEKLKRGYKQTLPNPGNHAECHMTKISCYISDTTQILNDPINNTNELIIDSGCTDHMFNTNVQMTDYLVLPSRSKWVSVANGLTIPVLGVGTCGILKTVYYVPELSHSLLSVRSLAKEGCHIVFQENSVTISPGSSKKRFQPIIAYVKNNLYRIDQNEFELCSGIPHQSCLVHRVQERDLLADYSRIHRMRTNTMTCHLVDDARTDAISTWHTSYAKNQH